MSYTNCNNPQPLLIHQSKKNLRIITIISVSVLLFIIVLLFFPFSTTSAHQKTSFLVTPAPPTTIQATPTTDATVTALNKELLQHEDDWWWNYGATVLTSLISTFTLAAAGMFTVVRYFNDRRDAREKQETETNRLADDRKAELEKRAEERFQAAVAGLGDDKNGARIGAAILLRTFLRPGHEQFYIQTFDLVVAHLRLPRTSTPPSDAAPLPLTTLCQALIVAFKEAFPLARKELEQRSQLLNGQSSPFNPQLLDATTIQLDNAYLRGADLEQIWMPQASLRKVDLIIANLSGANLREADLRNTDLNATNLSAADLRGADLRGADLKWANLRGARLRKANLQGVKLWKPGLKDADLKMVDLSGADLRNAILSGTDLGWLHIDIALSLDHTDMRGVTGLTREQLIACKAKGAIIDDDLIKDQHRIVALPPPASTTQTSLTPSLPSDRTIIQNPSTAPAQENTPSSDPDQSSTVSSLQKDPEL